MSPKWPSTLSQSEELRDKKREELSVMFRRFQAIQLEMKEMEKELLELDDHIDTLEQAERKKRNQICVKTEPGVAELATTTSPTDVHHHAALQETPPQQSPPAPVASTAMTTQLSPSEILTDPNTQLTQVDEYPHEDFAPPMPPPVAPKPAPLLFSTERRKSTKPNPANSVVTSSATPPFQPLMTVAASSRTIPRVSEVSPDPANHSPTPSNTCYHPMKAAVHGLLRQAFQLSTFRHAQEEIIYATLDRQDVFVVMRTGGGKSLTYQLPALLQRPQQQVTLVVSPLVSLIHDQEYQMNQIAPGSAVSFTSGIGSSEHARRWDLVRQPHTGVCLVLVTPEKVHKSPRLRNELQKLHDQGRLARFVIDEAHCASQWGISFRPDYAQLGILKRHFPSVPVLAVTATASERVRQDVCNILGLNPRTTRIFRSTANRPNLRYLIRPKPDSKNAVTADMAAFIQTHHPTSSGIIYTLSKKEADTVAASLRDDYGIPAAAYHSEVSATNKERIHREWMNNRCQVVVATIAFGLGINKQDVRFVLHHCISKNLDSYYQESGRAGRDGQPADCVLYYGPKDVPRMCVMVHDTPGGAESLIPMVRYAQAFGNDAVCRAILLRELGEPDAPLPTDVINQEGDATTALREIGRHAQTVTRLVYQSSFSKSSLTMSMAIKAWRATKDVDKVVAACPPKDLTLMECELIVVALLLEDILRFHVHWTSYQGVAYLQVGHRGEAFLVANSPVVRVRFPHATKKAAAPKKAAKVTSNGVKRKARKTKTSKKVPTKKGTTSKKKKTTAKQSAKPKQQGNTLDSFLAKTACNEVIELSSDEEDDCFEAPVAQKRAADEIQHDDDNDESEPDYSGSDEEFELE